MAFTVTRFVSAINYEVASVMRANIINNAKCLASECETNFSRKNLSHHDPTLRPVLKGHKPSQRYLSFHYILMCSIDKIPEATLKKINERR